MIVAHSFLVLRFWGRGVEKICKGEIFLWLETCFERLGNWKKKKAECREMREDFLMDFKADAFGFEL